jgi:Flp pilus assembly protein TadG
MNLRSKLFQGTSRKAIELARDRAGNTAIIFAVALLPLLMLGGMAIDMRRAANSKAFAKDAMDVAVLAGSRALLENSTKPKAVKELLAVSAAKDAFNLAIAEADGGMKLNSANFIVVDGKKLTGTATVASPTTFAAIIGQETMEATVSSEAQSGDTMGFEIILVLDNTTSMFEGTRMEDMRGSAKTFVERVFSESADPSAVRVGVIPTASLININVEAPRAFNLLTDASLAATPAQPAAGSRTSPNPSFESREKYLRHPESNAALNVSSTRDLFEPVDWRGCVRAAAGERIVNSAGNVTGKLTDDAVPSMRWPVSRVDNERIYYWVDETPATPPETEKPVGPEDPGDDSTPPVSPPPPPPPPPPPSPPPPAPPGVQGSLDYLVPNYGRQFLESQIENARATYFKGKVLACEQYHTQYGHNGARNVYISKNQDCTTTNKSKQTGTIEACVSDPNEFDFISSGGKLCAWESDILPWDSLKPISGPNLNCPTAMLGLSSSPSQVFEKLDHMYPVPGGTQMDVGMMWALRALSPKSAWTDFFGYSAGNKPQAFEGDTTRKMVILLTDGANAAPWHYEGYYGCLEGNSRTQAGACWQSDDIDDLSRDSLDSLLIDSCEAMRDDYGVEVYTIAVDVADADAQATLESCAGSADNNFIVSSDGLSEVFQGIAERNLRLTK